MVYGVWTGRMGGRTHPCDNTGASATYAGHRGSPWLCEQSRVQTLQKKLKEAEEEQSLLRILRCEGILAVACTQMGKPGVQGIQDTMQGQLDVVAAFNIRDGVIPTPLLKQARDVCAQTQNPRPAVPKANAGKK